MAHRYDHLREKAISLRTERRMTLEDIVERLKLPKTTVYYWIKDIPIPYTERQFEAQRRRAMLVQAKFAELREKAYQQGLAEVSQLMQDRSFRDFVVLYMGEGYKRNRNVVAFVNSNSAIVKLANDWMSRLTNRKLGYTLQYYLGHNPDKLKQYWADLLGIHPSRIDARPKSNSGKLAGRNFRLEYGLLTVRVGDTYLRARLQAWMDFIKAQW